MNRALRWPLLLAAVGVALAGCSASDSGGSSGSFADDAASAIPSPEPALDECSPENLTVVNPGQLTVAALAPLEEPYFVGDKPSTGEGFEAALVYSIADGLGFGRTQVAWSVLPEGSAVDPGAARVDVIVGRVPVIDETGVSERSDPYLVGTDQEYALALPSGDPLVVCVNGVLAELEASGDLQELDSTWLP